MTKFWKICSVICLVFTFNFIMPMGEARADTTSTNSEITDVLCRIINMVTGPVGVAIATIIIFSMAFALFFGKMSWGMAFAVAVGMMCLFGAPALVAKISGITTDVCPKTSPAAAAA